MDKQQQQEKIIAAYEAFCRKKAGLQPGAGFQVERETLPNTLRTPSGSEHQKDAVQWATRRGRGLIAASFGVGKTRIQIELLRQVHQRTGMPVLQVCPLGVRQQFTHEDGPEMGVRFQYVGSDEEAENADTPFLITNYERLRDGQLSQEFVDTLGGVCLDEAAILGNLGTKTQSYFVPLFADVPYRWCATATPAPNDYRQIIYYADFLGVMESSRVLTKYFMRNPDKAGDLQIMPHREEEFWLWVASWALFIHKPSDLGYSDDGYSMPKLEIVWHRITADHEKAFDIVDQQGQRFLFKDTAAGITQAMREKRDSLDARVAKAAEVVNESPNDHWIIWHHLEDERRAIKKAIPNAAEVYGSLDLEAREQIILDFSHGKLPILATKPSLSGSGCNFQHYCHKAIYVGLNFQFRDFIQSVHRLLRYGQTQTVELHIVHTDAEDHVAQTLMRKWEQHDAMVERMRAIIRDFGLTTEALQGEIEQSFGVERQEVVSDLFTLINNDSVLETMTMPSDSVDCLVTSIPFGNHYSYVDKLNDFGHNESDGLFWEQMDFLIPELFRIMKPGRMVAIHCKDRLLYGHQTPHGLMEVDYFTHDTARAFRQHGFISYGEIFIPTDVVRENNSTNRLGWSENCKDSTKMGVGLSEKVLLFRKPQTDKSRSYADEPVRKSKAQYTRARWQIDAHSLWRSNGEAFQFPDPATIENMDGSQIYNWYKDWSPGAPYDYEHHVKLNEVLGDRLPAKFMLMPPQAPPEYAETVWTDVLFFQTLNLKQFRRRQEKHVCPFPFDIVRRLILRYSNPGEIVFDPFSGLGTTAYVAVQEGRKGFGIELNSLYFDASVRELKEAEIKAQSPSLFDVPTPHTNGAHA